MGNKSWLTIEIRPGEGGQEASDFAEELHQTIAKYARKNNLHYRLVLQTERNIVLEVSSLDVFKELSGVHRVQREPTNGKGRRHTSTASIAVLPTQQHRKIFIDPSQVREDVYKDSGPGGQHRNKTATAIRLTHLPTGTVVTAPDSRSQADNRSTAWDRLYAALQAENDLQAALKSNSKRVEQITDQGRSAKGWTHNWQRGEVVNHSSNQVYKLSDWLKGKW